MAKINVQLPIKPIRRYRLFPSVRLAICMLFTMGVTLAPAGCFGALNFALVCMVNASYFQTTENATVPHCQESTILTENATVIPPATHADNGEFQWGKDTRTNLLAGYAWGCVFMVIPSGWLIDKFGVKKVAGIGFSITALATILIPSLARQFGWIAVFMARVITGMCCCNCWSSIAKVAALWAGPKDKTTLLGFMTIGFPLGSFLANLASGYLCPLYGWPAVFYLFGALLVAWLVLFFVFFTDEPQRNRWISKDELAYAASSSVSIGQAGPVKTPWLSILLSLPVWAALAASAAGMWVQFFVMQFLPIYFLQVFNLDTAHNGLLSALPFLGQIVGRMSVGIVIDRIRLPKQWGPSVPLKLYNTVAMSTIAVCVALCTIVHCGQATVITALLMVQYFVGSLYVAGCVKSAVLLSPMLSGTIMGVSTFGVFLATLIMPYVVSALTEQGTQAEWNNAIFVAVGLVSITMLFFLLAGSGQVQSWAPETQQAAADNTDAVKCADANITPLYPIVERF